MFRVLTIFKIVFFFFFSLRQLLLYANTMFLLGYAESQSGFPTIYIQVTDAGTGTGAQSVVAASI